MGVVWQKGRGQPKNFGALRAHSINRTPLLKFLDPPLTGVCFGTLHISLLDYLKILLGIAFTTTSLLVCSPLLPYK
jgi:hypothetical protein